MNVLEILIYKLPFFKQTRKKNRIFSIVIQRQDLLRCKPNESSRKNEPNYSNFKFIFQFKAVSNIQEHVAYRQSHQDLIFP